MSAVFTIINRMTIKTAFVTGASRGIGRACALALAEAGVRVVLAARDLAKLEEAASEIRAEEREALVVAIDLASADSIKEAFRREGSDASTSW